MGCFAFLGDMKLGIELFRYSSHPDAPNQLHRLTNLLEKASPEYHEAFYNHTSGVYMSGLQTEQGLSLYLDVVPDSIRSSVLSYLINDIAVTNGGHTTSGIIGIKYVMEALSILDRADVALDLALQTTYPSWGYMIRSEYEPATTVWELWNSDTAGPGMNSRNHHMFGTITSWFYKYVAGIKSLGPGYSRVEIKPNVLRLDIVKASVVSPNGDIRFEYSKHETNDDEDYMTYIYNIILPPGTTGTFFVPIATKDRDIGVERIRDDIVMSVFERGKPIWCDSKFFAGVAGIYKGMKSDSHLEFEISNGSFQFEVRIKTVDEQFLEVIAEKDKYR
jgi:alpha-L-rhamnosidase